MSEISGGMSFRVRKPGDVERVFAAISRDLKHTYLLAYTPASGSSTWRTIEVAVEGLKGCKIRGKQGYFPE